MATHRPPGLSEGMHVFAANGDRIGDVTRIHPAGFGVERGHLFPKEFHVSFDQVDRVERHAIHLLVDVDQLVETIAGEPIPPTRPSTEKEPGIDPLTDARMTHRS